MKYYLAKSEPAVYSIGHLERDRKTVWDGVTNPQAVKAIRAMKPGDRVFFYHSGGVSAVAGSPTSSRRGATMPGIRNRPWWISPSAHGSIRPPPRRAPSRPAGPARAGRV